jgi:hypothetical protein
VSDQLEQFCPRFCKAFGRLVNLPFHDVVFDSITHEFVPEQRLALGEVGKFDDAVKCFVLANLFRNLEKTLVVGRGF